jgi:hypothetical protein
MIDILSGRIKGLMEESIDSQYSETMCKIYPMWDSPYLMCEPQNLCTQINATAVSLIRYHISVAILSSDWKSLEFLVYTARFDKRTIEHAIKMLVCNG